VPDRVIYVEAGDEKSVLICFEEGLRHGGLGTVVAELARLSTSVSRRLQLAAESSGTIGIAIRRWWRDSSRGMRSLRPTRELSTGSLFGPSCYAPIVAADPPDGLVIDVTGCRRYHRLLTLVCSTIF
jgi:hypothetical protein